MLTAIEIAACKAGLKLGDEAIEWITGLHAQQEGNHAPAMLIGESPGPRSNPDLPLWPGPRGTTGARLRHFAGLAPDTYLAFLERRNLVDHQVDHWPSQEASDAASVAIKAAKGRPMILLGSRVTRAVAAAAGRHDTPAAFEWFSAGESDAVRVPHPSGLCRSYAAGEVRRGAAAVIAEAFRRSLRLVRIRAREGDKATPLRHA